MTPRVLLDFLRSHRAAPIADGTVWRDPDEGTYLIREAGQEDHLQREGYERLGAVAEVKEVAKPNARYDSDGINGKLMEDLAKQIGRERQRERQERRRSTNR